jgi:SAM-dependent methyltransferase
VTTDRPPVCDYEGSDYQDSFWGCGERDYEDQVEGIALRRLLPGHGRLLLELGAGAGRNTPRYSGYERVVLLDYSRTQLRQAQERLGDSNRYLYVAGDIYRLPFVSSLFDAATMIRTLHHMSEPRLALEQIQRVLQPGAIFILEFANKLNFKAILRYVIGRQAWNPFDLQPVEFAKLNFDFHPRAVRLWLDECGFQTRRTLTVSHFRVGWLKRLVPVKLLVEMDSLAQWTGAFWQFTPSVFMLAIARDGGKAAYQDGFFRCPECRSERLQEVEKVLVCQECARKWRFQDGIYDFREPVA